MSRLAMLTIMMLMMGGAAALAQPNPTPKVDPPGAIRGRITAADTGRPLRRATVSLRPDTGQLARPIATASTNSRGEFELAAVPPGSYFVSAARGGYIELEYGQRRPRERGLAVEVKTGEVTPRVDIALPKGGVLGGRLVDETGAPYPGVMVFALEMRYQQGARIPFPAGSTSTDDLGQYRLAGLQPGRFLLVAMPTETWRNEKRETLGYGATYFPGTTVPQLAQSIELGVSQERLDLDIALAANRTVSVRGRVMRETGQPMAGEPVALSRSLSPGAMLPAGSMRTQTRSDGSFEFKDVPPSAYIVRSGGGASGSASETITVRESNVDSVLLIPRTGSTIIGTVVTDESGPPPFSASGVRVNLVAPVGAPVLPTVRVPAVENDWTVRMTSVGGPFLFRMVNLPDEWMIDSVRVGERDITDVPWDVPTGGAQITDFQIVLTTKVGSVSGTVVDGDGKPMRDATVVVFSEDAAHWIYGSRYVRSTRPSVEGAFTIRGLPPGRYLVVAQTAVLDGEWETKEFLTRAAEGATRLTLERGATETVSLKVSAQQ